MVSGTVDVKDPRGRYAARFTAAVTREDDWYVARCLKVEVTSQGASLEEAVANLREALALYFQDTPLSDPLPTP